MYLHLIYAVIVSEEQHLIRTKMVKSSLIIIMYNSHSCNNGSDILVFFNLVQVLGALSLYTHGLLCLLQILLKKMKRRQPPEAVAKSYVNCSDPPWIEEKYIDNIKGR